MSVIDTDVEDIINEEIEDSRRRQLVRDILQWEEERMYDTIRSGKKDDLDQKITEFLKDK
jgi:hypothetical protein